MTIKIFLTEATCHQATDIEFIDIVMVKIKLKVPSLPKNKDNELNFKEQLKSKQLPKGVLKADLKMFIVVDKQF